MAFNIRITKTKINESDSGGIKLLEWRAYVDSDASLLWVEDAIIMGKVYELGGVELPLKRHALWFCNLENKSADLIFALGLDNRIVFGYGDKREYLLKICEVAESLGGFVQADDYVILNKSNFYI